VKGLERRRDEIQQMLRDFIKPVEKTPMGAENDTHSTSTTLTDNDKNHTVIAANKSSWGEARLVPDDQSRSKPKHLFPETLHITPATMVELAPRLAPYVPPRTTDKDWPAIVEAALFLSGEMGINRTLWARACEVMGREYAAVAVAIVSTRPEGHFTSGPGGYFAGMLRKFEKNPQDLCLSRTLWKLKDETWGAQGHKERREREKARRRSSGLEPTTSPVSGFFAVGTVLQRQAASPIPPARRANPAPVDHRTTRSSAAAWQPSAELSAAEERIKAMFAKPADGMTSPDFS
jgi:hypothetical protein